MRSQFGRDLGSCAIHCIELMLVPYCRAHPEVSKSPSAIIIGAITAEIFNNLRGSDADGEIIRGASYPSV